MSQQAMTGQISYGPYLRDSQNCSSKGYLYSKHNSPELSFALFDITKWQNSHGPHTVNLQEKDSNFISATTSQKSANTGHPTIGSFLNYFQS